MAAQNPSVSFSNFEDEISLVTTAATNSVGDVILCDGGIAVIHTPVGGVFSIVAGTAVSARVRGRVDGMAKLTGVAWSAGAQLFWDPTNVGLTNVPTPYPAGIANTAQVSADTIASVTLGMAGAGSLIASLGAPVAGLTGNAEAVAATLNIPANLLISGQPITIDASFHATAQNSTDTMQTRVRVGGLSGIVVSDSGAVQSAAGTAHRHTVQLTPQVISASVGTAEAAGLAVAAATAKAVGVSLSSLNNTATIAVVVTYVWSSASAGNTATIVAATLKREVG